MASFTKRGDAWRVQVKRKGVRKTGTFDTKAQGRAWAAKVEAEIDAGINGTMGELRTFAQAIDRYVDEVSSKKKGERWERIRAEAVKAGFANIVNKNIGDVTSDDMASFRDQRLKSVQASSVNRELNLLSAIFSIAIQEWKWVSHNPVKEIRRPKNPRARDRRISDKEIEQLLHGFGYSESEQVETKMQHVAVMFLLAIESAMRMGELISLTTDTVHLDRRYVDLLDTKNGDKRQVPLSSRAIELLEKVMPKKGDASGKGKRCFLITTETASSLFRKVRERCGIKDLTFHDTRHEALTRLSKKLDVLPLARMVGHRDPRSLMIYYNETAEELALLLD